jgi:hypothetical protein
LDEPSVPVPVAAVSDERSWIVCALIGTLCLALVIASTIAHRAARSSPLSPLMRLNLDLGYDALHARGVHGGLLAVSPDGTRLAIMLRDADGKGKRQGKPCRSNFILLGIVL